MKRFCLYSQYSHLSLYIFSPEGGCSEGLDGFRFFLNMPTSSCQYWVWEREAYINWYMLTCEKATLVRNYLEVYWPCAEGLSAVNAIGTQLRDPINSRLTQWRLAVLNIIMDAAAEIGRNPVYKSTRFSLSMEMSRLTRDGTAEPVSRDQILRRKRGQGNINFPCSADHVQD